MTTRAQQLSKKLFAETEITAAQAIAIVAALEQEPDEASTIKYGTEARNARRWWNEPIEEQR